MLQENKRIPALDLLRSLAIFLVVLHHYPKSQDPNSIYMTLRSFGWIGVDIFFVLSGYLISKGLIKEFKRESKFSFSNFYVKRAFRILPIYWVVVALYFFLPSFAEREKIAPLWRFLTFTQNFDLTFSAFSHAWSLCIEEHFYLVLPISLFFLLKRSSSKLSILVFAGLILGGMVLRWSIWESLIAPLDISTRAFRVTYYKYLYYPTYGRLDGLVLGVLISTIQVYRPILWNKLIGQHNKLLMLGVLLISVALTLFSGQKSIISTTFGFPLLSLGIASIFISVFNNKSIFSKYKIPSMNVFATLAFSIYLTHKAVIKIVHVHLEGFGFEKFHPVTTLSTIVSILLFSWILFTLIEKPFLKFRERLITD